MITLIVGCQVRLMKGMECVGIGTLVDGDMLHGHPIPQHFRKVVLEAVKPGMSPELKGPFEDDCLSNGQFTAWPLNKLEFINSTKSL